MRYRVHFVAFFEADFDADDDYGARALAENHCVNVALPEGAICRWRVFEEIGDDD